MGGIIFPEFVKKRETSFPRSARRAMASAETVLGFLRVLFIEFPFLMRGFPKRDQVVVFACGIVAHLENQGVHSATHLADHAILFRNIRTRIQVVRTREDFPALPRNRCPALGLPGASCFSSCQNRSAWASITVIP